MQDEWQGLEWWVGPGGASPGFSANKLTLSKLLLIFAVGSTSCPYCTIAGEGRQNGVIPKAPDILWYLEGSKRMEVGGLAGEGGGWEQKRCGKLGHPGKGFQEEQVGFRVCVQEY